MGKGNPIMIALKLGKSRGGDSDPPPKGMSGEDGDEGMLEESDAEEAAGLVREALKGKSNKDLAKALKLFMDAC